MNPPYKITDKVLNLISKISECRAKIVTSSGVFSEPKLRKKNNIKTVQATLEIEGNSLSEEKITAILEGKRVVGKKREIIEATNAAGLYIQLEVFKQYSVKNFLAAHSVLMKNLIPDSGKFRDKNVGILKGTKVSHLAPKPSFVPEKISELFKWGRQSKEVHPLIKSSVFHYEIEFIHPFEDGNGRMGRFWQTLMLFKWDPIFQFIPVESLIRDNQKFYYKALEQSDSEGESTKFIEFILQIIMESIEEFSSGIISQTDDTSSRLDKAKAHFRNHSFSRKEYMVLHKSISSATASRDLKSGLNSSLLEKKGFKNQTRYKFHAR